MDRRRVMRWALCGLGGLLWAGSAQAQDQIWLRDNRLTSGPGLKGEKLEFKGGIQASIGYDSNVFLRADTALEPRADAFRLMVTPFMAVTTRNPSDGSKPSYIFSGNASATYFEFIPGPKKSNLPGDELSGHRNVGVGAGLGLQIAPGARWRGELHAGVSRSIQPSNLGDPTASFNRTTPSGGASVTWAPGGGLFSWKLLGYDVAYNYFEADRFERLNNFTHQFTTGATWQFLPKTTLFSDSRLMMIRYRTDATEQSNGDAVSTRVGVNGLLTKMFGFLVSGGWSSTVFSAKGGSTSQDFDSFIAQAEGRFYLSSPERKEDEPGVSPSMIAVGYVRDWSQSYIGNFYQRDRGYATMGFFYRAKLLGSITGGVSRLSFPSTTFESGAPRSGAFTAIAADALGFLEYRFIPNFGMNLSAAYTTLLTDTKLRTNEQDPTAVDELKWQRIEIILGARYLL